MVENSHKVQSRSRLDAAERRRCIIEAAIPLFAAEGFRGVTTRELARQAGISEALLYRHFPSKEALYGEVLDALCRPPDSLRARVEALPRNTETLVVMLFMMGRILVNGAHFFKRESDISRLVLGSILDDGAFARLMMQRQTGRLVALMRECYGEALKVGDVSADGAPMGATFDEWPLWFCHHLFAMLHFYRLPTPAVLPYPAVDAELLDRAMRFLLRGLGLKPAVLAAVYDFARLDAMVTPWLTRDT